MTFRDFQDEVKASLRSAMDALSYPSYPTDLSLPPDPSLGDISSSVPLKIGKSLRKDPRAVAEALAHHVNGQRHELISKCESHPSGYLNFHLHSSNFALMTLLACSKPDFGKVDMGGGGKATVEHTSVNPAHHLHVGHLRNVVIGDSVARILRFTGWRVVVLNYIDDLGLQVADLLTGLRRIGDSGQGSYRKYDHLCGSIYATINSLYDKEPELLAARAKILKELEDPSSETSLSAQSITRKVVKAQLETCWRIGARYDCLNFESHIISAGLWDEVFREMKDKGIAQFVESGKLAGCWIVRIRGEEEGEEKVLVRSDGTTTYVAKDIPYAAWKLGLIRNPFRYEEFAPQGNGKTLWSTAVKGGKVLEFSGAEKVVNTIDERQARLQRIVLEVLSQLQGKSMANRYVHLSYGLVALSKETADKIGIGETSREFAHMSGRKGIYVGADEFLDRLHFKAIDETAKRNPDPGKEDWLEEVAEAIAVGAVRYALLRQEVGKQIIFDMDEAMKLIGETGPYLQYSYARASRILEKAQETPSLSKEISTVLGEKEEVELLKLISKLDMVVEEAATNLTPNIIARYAYQLCVSFNSFYESLPVLKEGDEKKRSARLLLVQGFMRALEVSLELLGIKALSRI